ncbi:hypothetical protein NC651_026774 [Populus alba x Populus x berolinensis]|nr:hypothetical protein NC651_026774 [Populus alba x Populus x berolinensis]
MSSGFSFLLWDEEEGRAHEKAKTREGRVSSVNGLLGYFYFARDFLYRIGQSIAILLHAGLCTIK